jgi:hypothetical protein
MAFTDTKFSICSRASALIGGPPVNDFESGSDIAQKCKQLYEGGVEEMMTRHPWQFCKRWTAIERNPETPALKWSALYNFPNDCLEIRSVWVNDAPIDYEVLGRGVYCDAVETDIVVAEYTIRAAEYDWPPMFSTCMVYRMTGYLSSGHAERASLAKIWLDELELNQLPLTRHADAMKQPTQKMPKSRRLIGLR